jgi:hypothetical protein
MIQRPKVYIVGIDHRFQVDRPPRIAADRVSPEAIADFRRWLISQCEALGIEAIAEEMSTEIMFELGAEASVCYEAASRLGIKHQYTDPSSAERREQGILDAPNERERAKRRLIWLEKLRSLNT